MNNQMPLQIQILTNLDCNLRCTYCYENKGRGLNDIKQMKNFVTARLKDAEGNQDVILDFIGGESLLYPDVLDELVTHAHVIQKGIGHTGKITVSLSTNGTLIDEDKKVQDFLLKWRPCVGFSIDGTKEIHDACRIDTEGSPSYDRAVAGWYWTRQHLCPKCCGVKATYTHTTIGRYAEGVINLIKLGFIEIAANVVFEEQWTKEEAPIIYKQMQKVIDYLFEKKLQNTVHIFQINNADLDMRHYKAEGRKAQNHCGTCTHMRTIGFDGLVYGCNRFCSMKNPIPIGYMDGKKIVITPSGREFTEEVTAQYKEWPQECLECKYANQCPSCSAIPYEQDGPKAFFARKPQCGFTYAIVAARLYFKYRLLSKGE